MIPFCHSFLTLLFMESVDETPIVVRVAPLQPPYMEYPRLVQLSADFPLALIPIESYS